MAVGGGWWDHGGGRAALTGPCTRPPLTSVERDRVVCGCVGCVEDGPTYILDCEQSHLSSCAAVTSRSDTPPSTFTPLIFSGIIYAANGEFPVDYIDCLFNCVSAMTVCGLATVDLSGLTPVQQVLLFVQMCLGSPVRLFHSAPVNA